MLRRLPLLALLFAACLSPVSEPDCLLAHTCDCKTKLDCPTGTDCINGHCGLVPDAGNPGDFGTPCNVDADCTSGPCLPKGPGNGGVCSAVCNADGGTNCQRGWDCKQSLSAASYVCTPPLHSLCLSCRLDTDCNAAGDRCIAMDGGSFCGEDCSLKGCAQGYQCLGMAVDAGIAHACVPTTGTCSCGAINVGLTRSCKSTAPLGTCYGVETCTADAGYTGCDARIASPEICDGIDDDCDGLTDDADPKMDHSGAPGWPNCTRGTACMGEWFCGPQDAGIDAGPTYTFLCSAPPAKAEICNGVDDNCNGLVDEGFTDDAGVFSSPLACGSCALNCTTSIPNLEGSDGDAGVTPGAVDCVQDAGSFRCVPRTCAAGYFAWPPGTPEQCQRATTSQCRTCTIDSDCGVPGDTCNTLSNDVGTYCEQSCDPAAPYPGCTGQTGVQSCCPIDSTCQSQNGKLVCVPQGNACSCTPARIGFTRSCLRTAGTAVCIGQQICGADAGFNACDSSLTALELCDGLDNDCDGVVDQPFINTQDSGTYDTDEHCGNCTTNCTAQWSPTIQHAIGGCRLAPAPTCEIIACTSSTIPGGKLCQSNSDCGGGVCDPTFHQCACNGTMCGAGEVCSAGFCTRACMTSSTCSGSYGATSQCGDAGVCVVPYAFVDADKDSTNGCECPAASGVADAPDIYQTYPAPGVAYVDRDCDGIDGVAATSLFVWAQTPNSQGTRAKPYRTLREAVQAFDPTRYTAILVAQGSYTEQVVLKNGVQIFGGYSSDFTKRDVVTFPTLIEAPEPDFTTTVRRGSVNAEGLTSTTVLAGFTIRGYDVTTRAAAGQPGHNTYAVFVKNSPGLTLANNHIFGGRAGDAIPAAAGTAGVSGGSGARGLDSRECATPDCTGEQQAGGTAGTNASCTGAIGTPGARAILTSDPQDYQQPLGLNGQGGANAIYEHSDPSQFALCKYDCTLPNGPLNGGPATNGGDGVAGGRGPGCSAPLGMLNGDDWISGAGLGGSAGALGFGAGGGGAGGCVDNQNPSTCTIGHLVGDLGATGGGGGAGGCGGGAGLGGAGGGGSFGIFVTGGLPTVFGNIVEPGFGGSGAPGGAGGYGGLGGAGGSGGVITTVAWCGGQGGPGGRGGNGGGGGGGGGGCGGASFGIAGSGIAGKGFDTSNTLVSPPINAAGAGGTGGASPAGASASGGVGTVGMSATLGSF